MREKGEDEQLLDAAANPNSMVLATAVAHPAQGTIEVMLRDFNRGQVPMLVTRVEGHFAVGRLTWLDMNTLALVLADLPAEPAADDTAHVPSHALFVFPVQGYTTANRVNLDCASAIDLMDLKWAPGGKYALGQHLGSGAPMVITMLTSKCSPLQLSAPYAFRFLSWDAKGQHFLYASSPIERPSPVPGVFEHDVISGADRLIAAPAPAAAYVHRRTVAVAGNRKLSAPFILAHASAPVPLEIALIDPDTVGLRITPLGLTTSASMLTRGEMTYSEAADAIAVHLFLPDPTGVASAVAYYSLATGRGGLLASGAAEDVLMSWAPQGDLIALMDSTGSIAIVSPPPVPRESD
jgi:hypothetical protein